MADNEKTQCSRCEKSLDTEGYPLWCRECRAKYSKEYRDLQKQMSEGRGFLAGAEAMRKVLLGGLTRMHPASMLRVRETVDWIANQPTPRP